MRPLVKVMMVDFYTVQPDADHRTVPEFAGLGLQPVLEEIIQEKIQEIGQLGQGAFQSAAPIRKGELRKSIELISAGDSVHVSMADGTHYSGYGNFQLAQILSDNQKFRRSRQSEAILGYPAFQAKDPTAGWLDAAQRNFEQRLD